MVIILTLQEYSLVQKHLNLSSISDQRYGANLNFLRKL